MTTISLKDLEERLQENVEALDNAVISRYMAYRTFVASTPFAREIDEIMDLSVAFEGFQDRYRRLYHKNNLFHEKARDIGIFSKRLKDGAKKASIGLEDWRRDKNSIWQRLIGDQNRLTSDRIRMIKDVVSFQIYAAAHIILTNHTTEFQELVKNSNLRVLEYKPEKTFTGKGPNLLPRLPVPKIIRLTTYPLEHLRQSCDLGFSYHLMIPEGLMYKI